MGTVNNGFLLPMKMWLVVEPHNFCRLWEDGPQRRQVFPVGSGE